MTKRSRTSEQLSAYLDGELSDAERAGLEQALAKDAELAKELARLQATRALVRSLPREEAPADFTRAVVARLERQSLTPAAPGGFRAARWLTAAVAAVVLLAAGVAFYAVLLVGGDNADRSLARRAPAPDRAPVAASPGSGEGGGVAAVGPRQPITLPPEPPIRPGKGGGPARHTTGQATATIYIPVNTANLADAERGLRRTLVKMRIPAEMEKAPFAKASANAAAGQRSYTVAVRESQLVALVNDIDAFREKQNVRQGSPWADELALAEVTQGAYPAGKDAGFQDQYLYRGNLYRELLAQGRGRQQRSGSPGQAEPAAKPSGAAGSGAVDERTAAAVANDAKARERAGDLKALRGGAGRYDSEGVAKSRAHGDVGPETRPGTQAERPGPAAAEQVAIAQPPAPASGRAGGKAEAAQAAPRAEAPDARKTAETDAGKAKADKAAGPEFGQGAGTTVAGVKEPVAAKDGEKLASAADTRPADAGEAAPGYARRLEETKKTGQAPGLPKPVDRAEGEVVRKAEDLATRPASRPVETASRPGAPKGPGPAARQQAVAQGETERVYNICIILNDVSLEAGAKGPAGENQVTPQK